MACRYCGGQYDLRPHLPPKDTSQSCLLSALTRLRPQGTDVASLRLSAVQRELLRRFKCVLAGWDAPLVKISGGEITLWDDTAAELARAALAAGRRVQVLTNALAIGPSVLRVAHEHQDVHFQVSLDGVNHSSNRYRCPDLLAHRAVIRNIRLLCTLGRPVEVNMVLTNANTGMLLEELRAMRDLGRVLVAPRPVRGRAALDLCPTRAQVREVDALIDAYESLADSLPPLPYLVRLREILLGGRQEGTPCLVPWIVAGVELRGNLKFCTTSDNSLPSEPLAFEYTSGSGYGALRTLYCHATAMRLPEYCRRCITQYEILGLYVEGAVSEDELKRYPATWGPLAEHRLGVLRKAWSDQVGARAVRTRLEG